MSVEGIYTKQVIQDLGLVLAACLQDIVQVMPTDPIDFMSKWLYKYTDNRLYFEQTDGFFKTARASVQMVRDIRRESREQMQRLNNQLLRLKVFQKRMSRESDQAYQSFVKTDREFQIYSEKSDISVSMPSMALSTGSSGEQSAFAYDGLFKKLSYQEDEMVEKNRHQKPLLKVSAKQKKETIQYLGTGGFKQASKKFVAANSGISMKSDFARPYFTQRRLSDITRSDRISDPYDHRYIDFLSSEMSNEDRSEREDTSRGQSFRLSGRSEPDGTRLSKRSMTRKRMSSKGGLDFMTPRTPDWATAEDSSYTLDYSEDGQYKKMSRAKGTFTSGKKQDSLRRLQDSRQKYNIRTNIKIYDPPSRPDLIKKYSPKREPSEEKIYDDLANLVGESITEEKALFGDMTDRHSEESKMSSKRVSFKESAFERKRSLEMYTAKGSPKFEEDDFYNKSVLSLTTDSEAGEGNQSEERGSEISEITSDVTETSLDSREERKAPMYSKTVSIPRKGEVPTDLKSLLLNQKLQEYGDKYEYVGAKSKKYGSKKAKRDNRSSDDSTDLPPEELDFDEYGKMAVAEEPTLNIKKTPLWEKLKDSMDDYKYQRYERWQNAPELSLEEVLRQFSRRSDSSGGASTSTKGEETRHTSVSSPSDQGKETEVLEQNSKKGRPAKGKQVLTQKRLHRTDNSLQKEPLRRTFETKYKAKRGQKSYTDEDRVSDEDPFAQKNRDVKRTRHEKDEVEYKTGRRRRYRDIEDAKQQQDFQDVEVKEDRPAKDEQVLTQTRLHRTDSSKSSLQKEPLSRTFESEYEAKRGQKSYTDEDRVSDEDSFAQKYRDVKRTRHEKDEVEYETGRRRRYRDTEDAQQQQYFQDVEVKEGRPAKDEQVLTQTRLHRTDSSKSSLQIEPLGRTFETEYEAKRGQKSYTDEDRVSDEDSFAQKYRDVKRTRHEKDEVEYETGRRRRYRDTEDTQQQQYFQDVEVKSIDDEPLRYYAQRESEDKKKYMKYERNRAKPYLEDEEPTAPEVRKEGRYYFPSKLEREHVREERGQFSGDDDQDMTSALKFQQKKFFERDSSYIQGEKRSFLDRDAEDDDKTRPQRIKSKSKQKRSKSKLSKGSSDGNVKRSRTVLSAIGVWYYMKPPGVLVCAHPVLGELRPPQRPQGQHDSICWDREDISCESLYDSDIYVVCEPHADDDEYQGRMLEWTGHTWIFPNPDSEANDRCDRQDRESTICLNITDN